MARCAAIAGEDAGAIAVLVAVHKLHRRLERRHPQHAQHGPEDLLPVDAHLRLHTVEQAAAEEEALIVAGHHEPAPVANQLRTLGHALLDVTADAVAVLARDQRPHFRARLVTGPDHELADLAGEPGHQRVGHRVTHADDHRNGHAALAAGAIGGAHQRGHRAVEIGVRQHDRVVLGAPQRLHPLARGAAGPVDVLSHGRGTDKADCLHGGMHQQCIDRLAFAVDHVEGTRRQARLGEQPGKRQRRGRRLLRGLQYKGIAADQRQREHPQRHHRRKVERRDPGHDAQRLKLRPAVEARRDILHVLALEQLGRGAGVLDNLDTARHFAARIVANLAVFLAHQFREPVRVLFEQRLVLEHDPRPLQRRGRSPGRKRPGSRAHRRLDRRAVAERNLADDTARRRVGDRPMRPRAGHRDSVDPVPDGRVARGCYIARRLVHRFCSCSVASAAPRRRSKNCLSIAPHSSASTPPKVSTA